jgi:L-cysteine desulfidase
MGVGIPGTDMMGLPIAIALGAIIGKSEYGLEVLKDSNPEAVEEGKKMIDQNIINISLKSKIKEKLYIEVICKEEGNFSKAVICSGHTNFVYLCRNDEVFLDKKKSVSKCYESMDVKLNLKKVYDFATTTPLDEIRFILESGRMNMSAAERSLNGSYGHELGKILKNSSSKDSFLGSNTFSNILAMARLPFSRLVRIPCSVQPSCH